MCPSWDTCCAQHGQEHLFPCLPHLVQLQPILGLLLKAPDLHAIGLVYVPRKLLSAHRRAGGPPRVGTCGGDSGWVRTSPFSPSSPEDTSWPLISVSCALGTVSMAFVPLMGLCCSKAGVLTPGGDSALTPHGTALPRVWESCGQARERRGMAGAATCGDAELLSSLFSFKEKLLQISQTFLAKANKREINSVWGNWHQ